MTNQELTNKINGYIFTDGIERKEGDVITFPESNENTNIEDNVESRQYIFIIDHWELYEA